MPFLGIEHENGFFDFVDGVGAFRDEEDSGRSSSRVGWRKDGGSKKNLIF